MKTLKIKNILIPTDFSRTGLLAVQHAVFMARLSKADLYLLHAIESPDMNAGDKTPVLMTVEKMAVTRLNKLAASLRKKHGINVITICAHGKVAAEIVNAVDEYKIDIVVMGTHGATGLDEYVIGSNAHKTVMVCPCPVITVQTNAKKLGFTNIVLPIDDKFNSRQKVNAAIALAKQYAAKIHLLGLVDKDSENNPKTFEIKLESVKKAIQKAGLAHETSIVEGNNLSVAALKHSKKIKADLIVVLTNEESQLNDTMFSPFAKQIVNHSKIPVLNICPTNLGVYDIVSLPGFR